MTTTTTTTPKERAFPATYHEVTAMLSQDIVQVRRAFKNRQYDDLDAPTVYAGHDGILRAGQCTHNLNRCPFGKVGDRLWVQETFTLETNFNLDSEESYPPPFSDGRPVRREYSEDDPSYSVYWEQPHYRATDPTPELAYDHSDSTCLWKSSTQIPRWASRLTLEITAVRVERLQSVKAEGCIAMGFSTNLREYDACCELERLFSEWWNETHGKRPGCSFADNPWVWVCETRRVKAAAE